MTSIIKNIHTPLAVKSHFSRMLAGILLTIAMMIGGSGSAWAIEDFTIDLTKNPVDALPSGVTQISYPQNGVSFNDSQHGWCWYGIEFEVDGPVKITLGGCQHINTGYEGYVSIKDGAKLADIHNKTSNCYDADPATNVGTYIYTGGTATLQLYCGQYCPYVKVEKINTEFTIDLTTNPIAALPGGVSQISYKSNGAGYNGSQHGWQWYAIQFPVVGPCNIYVGGCQYSNTQPYLEGADGNKIADIENKTVGCSGLKMYKYTGEAQVLKLFCGEYCPSVRVVTSKDEAFTANWDWTKKPDALNQSISSTLKWLESDNSNIEMYAGAANGTVNGAGRDNAQFNSAQLLIPVYGANDKISVVGYPGNMSYSIHGTPYTTSDATDIAVNDDDVAQGYIAIKAEDNKYLNKVTLVHPAAVAQPTVTVSAPNKNLHLYPLLLSKTITIHLDGINLGTPATNTIALESEVEGMELSASSATITDGVIDQDITLTYTQAENVTVDEATVNVIVTIGDIVKEIPVTYSAATTKIAKTTVDGDRTWTWSDIYKQDVQMNTLTGDSNYGSRWTGFANLYPWYTENANFHASDLEFRSNYPIYADGNGKCLHGTGIQFTTTVPGRVKISKFSTGNGADQTITVNGTSVGTAAANWSCNTDGKWVEVSAGLVTIEGSADVRIHEIVFEKKSEDVSYTATWDWQNNTPAGIGSNPGLIEDATGTVNSNVDGIKITVNASASGAKMAFNGNHAYFNAGTKLQIPVKAAGDKVSFYFHEYEGTYQYLKAHGTAMTAQNCDYTATQEDATAGYVEFTADNHIVYIHSITLKHKAPFQDFEIDLSKSEPTLPAGVTQVSYSQNGAAYDGAQHGWRWYAIEFDVDGPVEISVGGCQYINDGYTAYLADASGNKLADINNKKPGCSGVAKYLYEGSATTLRLYCGQYCPSIKVEAVAIPATRTMQDFSIDFSKDWASSTSIAEGTTYYVTATTDGVPTTKTTKPDTYLASFKGKYHSSTYGIYGTPKFVVPVDGPVRITYGCNDAGGDVTVKNAKGETVATLNTKASDKWNNSDKSNLVASTVYNSKIATTLTLEGGEYVPYIKIEKTELITSCKVTYYNTDGTKLGEETVDGSSALKYAYAVGTGVTIPEGNKFRGWYDAASNGHKVAEGTTITQDISLYAIATPEEKCEKNHTYTYDLTKDYFYQEDHEGITMTGHYYNGEGWTFANTQTIKLPVPGNSDVSLVVCQYSETQDVTVTDGSGNTVKTISFTKGTDLTDKIEYRGPATTLTIIFANTTYIHGVTVENKPYEDSNITKVRDLSLKTGDELTLSSVDFTTSSLGTCTYTSSDESIVTVDENGKITAVSAGSATITVTQAKDDNYNAGSVKIPVNVTLSTIVKPFVAVWDWKGNKPSTISTSPMPQYVNSYIDGAENSERRLEVSGTLTPKASDHVQLSQDAEIKVPIYSAGDLVTISFHEYNETWKQTTINGSSPLSSQNTYYVATGEDKTRGYITIKANADVYIRTITLMHNNASEAFSDFSFGNLYKNGETGIVANTWYYIDKNTTPVYSAASANSTCNAMLSSTDTSNNHGIKGTNMYIPVKAGTYRLILGGCQYGSGGFTVYDVMNPTNGFNVKAAQTSACYNATDEANTTKNVTIAMPKDGWIKVECGADTYLPYFSISKLAIPTITTDIESAYQTRVGKNDITLTVSAVDAESYQWYTCASDGTNPQSITEATSPGLDYRPESDGTYYIYCAVTNASGTVNSNIATITVKKARTFTDFKIDFRVKKDETQQYTVVTPSSGELPSNVNVSKATFNDAQHGANAATVDVSVDGPVLFKLGVCQYGGKTVTVSEVNGEKTTKIKDINTNGSCESKVENISSATYANYVTYRYNSETSKTLRFTLNGYLPYIIAEACEYVPQATVNYYDSDGTTLIGSETVAANTALAFMYGASNVTVESGKRFRGWYESTAATAKRVDAGITLDGDIDLYAKVTPIEVIESGQKHTYTFTQENFYHEEHDLIEFTGSDNYFHSSDHGWRFNKESTIRLQVPGDVRVKFTRCRYSSSQDFVIKDADGNVIHTIPYEYIKDQEADEEISFEYHGNATTLVISFGNEAFFHNMEVSYLESVNLTPRPPYDVVVTNVSELRKALNIANGTAQSNYKIFIQNGTYNLGTDFNTQVKSYTSLIGESRDGVIIQNTPVHEGLNTSATFKTGSNVIMQNLTLHSIVSKESGDERGPAIYDEGSNNVYKNIRILGRQDTYYSRPATKSYFEDCEIHGAVDFICGRGNVWFEHCDIKIEQSTDAWITAPQADAAPEDSYKGYTFNNCTISNATDADMDGKYYLGRGWSGKPKTVFAGCTYEINPASGDYDRTSWAHGTADSNDNNSGMTKQDTPLGDAEKTASIGAISSHASISTPQNVVLNGTTLTWDAVTGASAYAIYLNGVMQTIVVATEATTYEYNVAGSSAKGMSPSVRRNASSSAGYSVAAISADGIIGEAKTAEEAAREFNNFALDFTTESSFIRSQTNVAAKITNNEDPAWTNCSTGVAIADDGTPSCVAIDANNSVVTINAYYHGTTYGVAPNSFVVPVDGPVKFTFGTSDASSVVTITSQNAGDAESTAVGTLDINGAKYSDNHSNTVCGYYDGPATTLTFEGGSYVPYFAVESISSAEIPYAINYSKTDESVTGIMPDNVFITKGSEYTLPVNKTLYKEGHTLTGWSDGTNTHNPGATITPSGNMNLVPVFTQNTKTIDDRKASLVLKWEFGEGNGTPSMSVQGNTGFLVTQATVDGETIDVKIAIDATASGAKFSNAGRNDKWAQVTGGTKFTIPNYKGATVSLETYSATTTTTVNGVAATGNTKTTYSTEVTGSSATIDIVMGDGGYLSYIQTVLPKKKESFTERTATWDWKELIPSSINETNIEGAKGTVASNVDGVELSVDASNSGKLAYGNNGTGYAQFNSGTVIRVPVRHQGDTVTVVAYPGQYHYTVAGTAATADETTYTATSTDANNGYVEIVSTATAYLYSISVKQIAYEEGGRSFTDFKIDFRTDPYTVVTPEAGLPTGVEVSQGGYNGGQHGATNTTITVPVDGPVKFTIGGCTYTGGATVSINGGAAIDIDTKGAGCDNGFGTYTKFATYLYNEEKPATLVFNLGSYCPYIFAEACDYVPPVTITYYDSDGTTKLDEETVFGGSNLKYKDGVANGVTVPEGYRFRGWFSSTGDDATKVAEGTPVNGDLNLYAKATPIETVTDGSEFEYILGHTNFYQEDHENITISGGSFHDTTHGWVFNGGTISVNVAKESYVILGLCAYSNGGDITATVNSKDLGVEIPCKVTVDGTLRFISYEGEENATMVINIPNGAQYIHSVKIVNRKYTKPITVTFENKNKSISGTVPDSQEADLNNKVTMPYGFTLYREGWSLTGWRDADGNVYNVGTEYTLVKDITVSPVMVQNEVAITDVTTAEEQTVQWNFGLSSNPYAAPVMKLEGEDGFYMKQTSIDGKPLDLRMDIKARNGKYDSSDSRVNALAGEGCQLNDGTVLTIPAVPGMTVTLKASAKNDTEYNTTTNFTGENCAQIQFGQPDAYVNATVVDATTVTYTYTGNASTLDVFIKKAGSGNTWGFFEYLEVKYPILPYITIVPVIDEDPLFANELPARAGEVGMTESPTTGLGKRYAPNDNVTIYAEAAYGYTVHGFKDSSDNDLTSGTYQVKNDNGEVIATLPSATYTIPEGDTKNNIIKVIYKRQTLYAVTTTVLGSTTPADGLQHGQITLSPKYDNLYVHNDDGTDTYYYTQGTEVTANSIADREYIVEQWSDDDEGKGNANSYTFTVGEANRAIKVRFRIGFEGTVTFNIEGSGVDVSTATFNGAISEAPATQTNVRSFYIPKFYTFFNNGHTLTHWMDASGVKYQLGQFYSFKEENQQLTLTPVFEGNIADKENRTRGDELYWDFRISEFAQTVDMDAANKNTFWTGKVDVEVIEGGQNRAHTRDVALWVHTGEEGYVRNSDMQDWAAFGPGTSFDLPSCAGATIKMLTFSEITSTTFDGHIPELDQQATDSLHALGERGYVYKYTTTNANARVTIVIGDDDYSYYKWIRCFTLPANMVNLHIDLDDKGRGQINSIATAVEGHDMKELEDGGVAFNKGERVCVEFQRKFGLEFSKVIDTDKGITVFELLEDGSARMINMNDGYETVSVQRNADGTYGRYDADNTSNNTSFYFDVPVDAGTYSGENDSLRTAYKLYFSMNNHRNLQICFKEISTYYVTYNAGRLAEGAAPASHWLEKGDTYTISPNNTLYYEGHTLKYWEDKNGDRYAPNTTYTLTEAQGKILYPVFEANTFSLVDIPDGLTATWNFSRIDGAPTFKYERSSGILVTQLKNGDDFIDLKLFLDATEIPGDGPNGWAYDSEGRVISGKISNADKTNTCQINEHSKITFPSTMGSTFSMVGAGLSHVDATSAESPDASATRTIKFTMEGSVWVSSFSVAYKKPDTTTPELASLTYGSTSLTDEQLASLKQNKTIPLTAEPYNNADESMPQVTATATNGYVSVNQATILTREASVTLRTSENGILVEAYTIKFNFGIDHAAPVLTQCTVNSSTYSNPSGSVSVGNVPVSGSVTLTFNKTMAASTVTLNGKTLKAEQGRSLTFRYWDLEPNKDYDLVFEASSLKSIYDKAYPKAFTIRIHTSETVIPYEHRKFDYIVTGSKTLDDAISNANASASQSDRYYVFLPDGDYSLTGNENITLPTYTEGGSTEGFYGDKDGNQLRTDLSGKTFNNGMTRITRPNVSIIGQSHDGVTVHNHPTVEGISYTATIHLAPTATDFYAEDLVLKNDFDYWTCLKPDGNDAARGVVLWNQGNRSVLKNVSLNSWQDTYYSMTPENSELRGYFEDCNVYGVVDYLCGDGDIWFERTTFTMRDRDGNNIAAPRTLATQTWGYVMNNCVIKNETYTASREKTWTLARPWGLPGKESTYSPAMTLLNTRYHTMPRDVGYNTMHTGLVLRFHEYHSMNAAGTPISLGSRSLTPCTPAAGSDDCILSEEDAGNYTVQNVMGGGEAFDPRVYTKQIDAASGLESDKDPNNTETWNDGINILDGVLQWKTYNPALCYFVFYRASESDPWTYREHYASDDAQISIDLAEWQEGYYCVRAANQRGGLGAATKSLKYVPADVFELTLSKAKDSGKETDQGWSTICLPNNAKVPAAQTNGSEGNIKVYAAVSISGNTLTLKKVDYITANKGYVVYGTPGTYSFRSSSYTAMDTQGYTYNHDSYLDGNPSDSPLSASSVNCYTLAFKPNVSGIGFYKFAGASLKSRKAYLDVEVFKQYNTSDQDETDLINNASARGIRFVFAPEDDATDIPGILDLHSVTYGTSTIYDLSGRPVRTPLSGHIYIINGTKTLWE